MHPTHTNLAHCVLWFYCIISWFMFSNFGIRREEIWEIQVLFGGLENCSNLLIYIYIYIYRIGKIKELIKLDEFQCDIFIFTKAYPLFMCNTQLEHDLLASHVVRIRNQ